MKITHCPHDGLASYLIRQLNHFFPGDRTDYPEIHRHIGEALDRLQRLINSIRCWKMNEFDLLHSTQYSIFLYFLSNTLWRNEADSEVCTRLFLLNKALNGIDCFYEIEMPEVFFIGHTVGIVLAKATYANYLVLYQNSTVGKNHGVAPVIEEGVIMYPNTAIIGRSYVKSRTVLSQGTSVINRTTPGDCLVFPGSDGELVFKPNKRDILDDIFRK